MKLLILLAVFLLASCSKDPKVSNNKVHLPGSGQNSIKFEGQILNTDSKVKSSDSQNSSNRHGNHIHGTEDTGGGNLLVVGYEDTESELSNVIRELFVDRDPDAEKFSLSLWAVIEFFNLFEDDFKSETQDVFNKILDIERWYTSGMPKNRLYEHYFEFEEQEAFPRNFSYSSYGNLMKQVHFENECFDFSGRSVFASISEYTLNANICVSLMKFSEVSKINLKSRMYGILFHELCHMVGETSGVICNEIQLRIETYQVLTVNVLHGFSFATEVWRKVKDFTKDIMAFNDIFVREKTHIEFDQDRFFYMSQKILTVLYNKIIIVRDLANNRYQVSENKYNENFFDMTIRLQIMLNHIASRGVEAVETRDPETIKDYYLFLEDWILDYYYFVAPELFKTIVTEM